MAIAVFLDTSVLLAGLIDFGPQSAPAQRLMDGVVSKSVPGCGTAWHCCLEFFSVATRLPAEFRLRPADAGQLLLDVVLANLTVRDLPAGDRVPFLKDLVQEGLAGGRVYDAQIAEVARAAGAKIIVTDNRRHFLAALRHGIRVQTPAELVSGIKRK